MCPTRRFNGSSTAMDVLDGIDLKGKIAIVTGSNTGLGYETAKSLALHGCLVILACRSVKLGEEAAKNIELAKPNVKLDVVKLCLGSLESVKEFAEYFNDKYEKLDILILNAGIFAHPYSKTTDGFESSFQVNYLSQAYLTFLLEEVLTKSAPSRVIVVSSAAHLLSTLSRDRIREEILSPKEEGFYSDMAYCHSKLLNVVFARQLSEKWASKGITAYSVHPGNFINTTITRRWWPYKVVYALITMFTKSQEQGASTQVFCATAPDLESMAGLYFENCWITNPSSTSQDPVLADRLWILTKQLLMRTGFPVKMSP